MMRAEDSRLCVVNLCSEFTGDFHVRVLIYLQTGSILINHPPHGLTASSLLHQCSSVNIYVSIQTQVTLWNSSKSEQN